MNNIQHHVLGQLIMDKITSLAQDLLPLSRFFDIFYVTDRELSNATMNSTNYKKADFLSNDSFKVYYNIAEHNIAKIYFPHLTKEEAVCLLTDFMDLSNTIRLAR